MIISRIKSKHGNIEPQAYGVLKMLPESVLHHNEHLLRNPSSIYSLSIQKVKDNLLELTNIVAEIQALKEEELNDFDYRKLLNAQEALLFSLLSHIDDCYLVLKTIHPYVEEKSGIIFIERWLKDVKFPTYEVFKKDICEYREKLALIVNKIKHEHGRIRYLIFCNKDVYAIGYYIEGIDEKGVVGPNPLIHSGGNTAFSFNYDIKYHLYNVYKISHYLTKAVDGAIKKIYGISVLLDPYVNIHSEIEDKTLEIFCIVSKLPYRIFVDEKDKALPVIEIKKDKDIEVIMDMPGKMVPQIPNDMRVRTSFIIDGKHRLPYYKYFD